MDLTRRLPALHNITCGHSLNRLDDTFSAKHKPEKGIVILLFSLFLEKKGGQTFNLLKKAVSFPHS